MQKRLNVEIRRRERAIRILANDQSAIRIVGALVIEQTDEWRDPAQAAHETLLKSSSDLVTHP
jgi:transposase-like protein